MKDPRIDGPCGSQTKQIPEATAIATVPCPFPGPTNLQDPAS
jgi:hypothetical protein